MNSKPIPRSEMMRRLAHAGIHPESLLARQALAGAAIEFDDATVHVAAGVVASLASEPSVHHGRATQRKSVEPSSGRQTADEARIVADFECLRIVRRLNWNKPPASP